MSLGSELAASIYSLTITAMYIGMYACMDQVLSNCEVSFPDAALISSRARCTKSRENAKTSIHFLLFFSIWNTTNVGFFSIYGEEKRWFHVLVISKQKQVGKARNNSRYVHPDVVNEHNSVLFQRTIRKKLIHGVLQVFFLFLPQQRKHTRLVLFCKFLIFFFKLNSTFIKKPLSQHSKGICCLSVGEGE